MNRVLLSAIVFFTSSFNLNLHAVPINTIQSVPAELIENADAVTGYHKITFEIRSISTAVETHHLIVHVLNPRGDPFAYFSVTYNKFRQVSFKNGAIYDASGKRRHKIKSSDIKDNALQNDYTLYTDHRRKVYTPQIGHYPYTVEYVWEISHRGLLNYPEWYPVFGERLSIQHQEYQVIVPYGQEIRIRESNTSHKVSNCEERFCKVYTWTADHLKALKEEPFSLSLRHYTPYAIVAPAVFELDGYKGDMLSWESFGEWVAALLSGANDLSPETAAVIQALVADTPDTLEKVKKVFAYMQGKTRYVNIVEGIGGWRPVPASTVNRHGYGDCKALVNYTRSLLEATGVSSFYSLVYAGHDPFVVREDFSYNSFNHAILCVPIAQDTFWLECTSQLNPFGHIAGSTDNRPALIIKNNKGKLVRTRKYQATENTTARFARLIIEKNGNAKAELFNNHCGFYYNYFEDLINSSRENQKKHIYENLDIPGAEVLSFRYETATNEVPCVTEKIMFNIEGFARGRERWYLSPNLPGNKKIILSESETRIHGFFVPNSCTETDSILFLLPENCLVEYLPASVNLSNRMGSFHARLEYSGNTIQYIRKLLFNQGRYHAGNFRELADFLKQIAIHDDRKIVLKLSPGTPTKN